MSIQVNVFQWEPGKNDVEYIKLLESSRDEWQKIAQKAIAKLKALLKAQEPVKPVLQDHETFDGIIAFNCGACGCCIGFQGFAKYCMKCGRKVKWND